MILQPKLEWQYYNSSETLLQIGINSGVCSSNASVAKHKREASFVIRHSGKSRDMDADALMQNWELNGGQLEKDFFSSSRRLQKHTGSLGYVKLKKIIIKKKW